MADKLNKIINIRCICVLNFSKRIVNICMNRDFKFVFCIVILKTLNSREEDIDISLEHDK